MVLRFSFFFLSGFRGVQKRASGGLVPRAVKILAVYGVLGFTYVVAITMRPGM